MPVIIRMKLVLDPSSSSNKLGEGGEKVEVVYGYEILGLGKVRVLAPFIDKISITLPVTGPDRQGMIKESLIDAAKKGEHPWFDNAETKGGYAVSVNCTEPSSGEKVLIQAQPTKSTIKNFMRFEFNPARIGAKGLSEVKAELAKLTLGALTWKHVIAEGKATRIDAATDVVNAPTKDLLYRSHTAGKTHIYVGAGGDLETAYLGLIKPGKASDQVVYDKTQQQKDTKVPLSYGGTPTTRVEMVYKYPHQKLSKIAGITKNLFQQVVSCTQMDAPTGSIRRFGRCSSIAASCGGSTKHPHASPMICGRLWSMSSMMSRGGRGRRTSFGHYGLTR